MNTVILAVYSRSDRPIVGMGSLQLSQLKRHLLNAVIQPCSGALAVIRRSGTAPSGRLCSTSRSDESSGGAMGPWRKTVARRCARQFRSDCYYIMVSISCLAEEGQRSMGGWRRAASTLRGDARPLPSSHL